VGEKTALGRCVRRVDKERDDEKGGCDEAQQEEILLFGGGGKNWRRPRQLSRRLVPVSAVLTGRWRRVITVSAVLRGSSGRRRSAVICGGPAGPAAIRVQRAPDQQRQQQAEYSREEHNDTHDVHVHSVSALRRHGKAQNGADGDQGNARAGTHHAAAHWLASADRAAHSLARFRSILATARQGMVMSCSCLNLYSVRPGPIIAKMK